MADPKKLDADLQACSDTLWDSDFVHPSKEGSQRLLDVLRKVA